MLKNVEKLSIIDEEEFGKFMKKKIIFALIIILSILAVITTVSIGISTYNKTVNTSWTLTQYGNQGLEQMMSFTIEGNVEGLVIVDGGYKAVQGEVDQLLNVIEKHDNVVDAWIITHLDSDHVGVYLNIIENHPEVKIKQVYTSNIPELDKAKEKAPWEGDWSNYEAFVEHKKKNKSIRCLSEGDFIDDVIGLEMDVLWSYSDWVYKNSSNLLNNGGLVFKLNAENESMLFFADIQDKQIGELLIEKYGEKLNSDYVQIAHHGNNKLPDEIYDKITPQIAFMPTPDWIFENPNKIKWFTASKIRNLLTNKGIIVYSDQDCPVSIIMK